jgi:hypothetical protein
MHLIPLKRPAAAFNFLLLGAITGCGESTGSVKGTVYLQDKLVTAGTVAFMPPNHKVATAEIRPDGSYEIQKVTVGMSKISVTAPMKFEVPAGKAMDPAKMGAGDKGKESEAAKGKVVPIPAMYGDPDKSGQTFTVKSGPQEYDIKLP